MLKEDPKSSPKSNKSPFPQLLYRKLNDQLLKDNEVVNTTIQYQKQKIPEGEGGISESWMDLGSSEEGRTHASFPETILDQLPTAGSLWLVIGVLALTPSPGTEITLSTC